jgi:hypothetical protein
LTAGGFAKTIRESRRQAIEQEEIIPWEDEMSVFIGLGIYVAIGLVVLLGSRFFGSR